MVKTENLMRSLSNSVLFLDVCDWHGTESPALCFASIACSAYILEMRQSALDHLQQNHGPGENLVKMQIPEIYS